MQEPQLHDDEEQEKDAGPAGAQEVLPCVPAPHSAQRSEVRSDEQEAGGLVCLSLITSHLSLFLKGRKFNG
jgi:hypothetical protein